MGIFYVNLDEVLITKFVAVRLYISTFKNNLLKTVMKKRLAVAASTALLVVPTVMAQYPNLTQEAKEEYNTMMTLEKQRSEEAWKKALPI